MQTNSVKPSSSPRVLSAQWLEHFQRFKHAQSLGGCHRCPYFRNKEGPHQVVKRERLGDVI